MNTQPGSFFREDTQKTSGLFEEVFENAGEAITVFDEDGVYHAFNPAFLKLTGYSPEELLTSDLPAVHALATDNERPVIQERLQEALVTGGPVRYERSFIRKDGKIIPARVTLVRLKKRPSWPKHRFLAVVSDISEIKAKEFELKRVYDAIEQAPIGILITDENRGLLYANAFLKNLTKENMGAREAYIPHQTCEQFLKTLLCDLPSCPGKLALKERAPKNGENVVLGPSKALSVNHLAQPLLGEDGTVMGMAEYFVDISEAKQREKELSLTLSIVQKTAEAIQRGTETRIHAGLLPNAYEKLGQGINATIDMLTKQKRNLLESREKLEHTNRFLKTVFDATQAGLMVVLRDGAILMANKTAKELLEDESLPGNHISAYTEDEALLLCQERLFSSGNGDLCPGHEATLASKAGRSIEVLCGHKPITHPSVFEPCVLLSFQDISGIKASLRYLERLLALLPVAYKLDDPETGLILEANKAFLEMFGYSPEELKSKTWMDLTPPRYLEQGLELARTSLETGGIVWEDKAYLAKDGREVPIRHGYTHIYHPGLGKIVALTLTLPKEGPLSLPQENNP
jgi:PAS domain S-box-containing protein